MNRLGRQLGFFLAASALAGLGGCRSLDLAKSLFHDYRSGQAVAADHNVLFYAGDLLLRPGQTGQLSARLETVHAFHGVSGVTVAFFLGDQEVARGVTDEKGLARCFWRPEGAGSYRLRARCVRLPPGIDKEERNADQAVADLLVEVCPPQRKFLAVDLDHTLVDESFGKVLTAQQCRYMAGSPQALTRLAGQYGIIYLTARPDALTRKSKLWLAQCGYPPGVLITCSSLNDSLHHGGQYKSNRLASLRNDFPNIQAGVGDQASDAHLDNDMTAYVITSAAPGSRRARKLAGELAQLDAGGRLARAGRVIVVANWAQIEQGLTRGQSFPPQAMLGRR